MHVSATTLLPGTAADAWQRLVAWEAQPSWMVDADEVRVLGAREGAGTRIAVRTRVLGVPLFTEVLEVTLWRPPSRLVMAHTGLVRGTGEWRLEPGVSGTRFTWTEDLRLRIPLLGELALRAYRPVMRRLMRRSLTTLRRTTA